MSRNLMVLFLLVAVISVTVMSDPYRPPPSKHCKPHTTTPPPPPKCGVNEVFKWCGTACQPSCKQPNPICNKKCVKGCFCKDGLLRNKWNKCVRPCDCGHHHPPRDETWE